MTTCIEEHRRHLVGQIAEWDKPVSVLVHVPNDGGELTIAGLHAPSALFEAALDSDAAAAQHRAFTAKIKELTGASIATVKDVLLEGTFDPETKQPIEGDALQQLRALAQASIDIACEDGVEFDDARKYFDEALRLYTPKRLFDVIMQRPLVTISRTDTNTFFVAKYEVRPVMNLYFMRDQTITTARGRVLMRLHGAQRAPEVDIVRQVLRRLGEEPVAEIQAPDTMEGGDFIPAGDFAFQGVGLRTSMGAVQQLMDADAYGSKYVVAVKDRWCNQEEMHLDTFFNVINSSTAVLVDTRLNADPESIMFTTVDTFERDDQTGKYSPKLTDVSFVEFLRTIGFTNLIPVSKADQLIYGCNFVTVGPNDIILVKRDEGISPEYRNALKLANVHTHEAEMSMLTRGNGAAHCSTQISRVLIRSPQGG